jgi:hypothetical protein
VSVLDGDDKFALLNVTRTDGAASCIRESGLTDFKGYHWPKSQEAPAAGSSFDYCWQRQLHAFLMIWDDTAALHCQF